MARSKGAAGSTSDRKAESQLAHHNDTNTIAVRELNAAAAAGDVNELKRLRRKGVDLGQLDYDMRGPLHVAAANGQRLAVEYILSQPNVNINTQDHMHNTPLSDARAAGHREIVAFLKEHGATVIEEHLGHQLCQLAHDGDLAGLKALDCRVDFNTADYDGRCCLHLAACKGRLDIVQFLCSVGARADIKDRWGGTPIKDAQVNRHEDVALFLRKQVAKHSIDSTWKPIAAYPPNSGSTLDISIETDGTGIVEVEFPETPTSPGSDPSVSMLGGHNNTNGKKSTRMSL